MFLTPEFWIAVGQIIMIDILLGGDNAVVIALACRKLPAHQQKQGILWGTAGAIVLRIVLIFFALQLLSIPFIKLIGAILLVWIGVKLLLPEHDEGHNAIDGGDRLWSAVKTVIVADFAMSLENVIAIAGAAETARGEHTMTLVIFGVLVSIPIIVWGSRMVIKLMNRFPIIITLGGMLLGWIAGTMAVSDPAVANPDVLPRMLKLPQTEWLGYGAGVAGVLLVLGLGKWLASRQRQQAPVAAVSRAIRPTEMFRRVLLAVDGSDYARRAAEYVVAMKQALREPDSMRIHLANVQRPVSGDVSTFIAAKTLQEYHHEHSVEATADVQALLDKAGVKYEVHERVGEPGEMLVELAQSIGCDLIVMGTRGLGGHTAALLGSVAQSTLEKSTIPVTLVK